jgi:hypothetical protein
MSAKRTPRWTCHECGATGTATTVKGARAELAHHYLEHHNDPDF